MTFSFFRRHRTLFMVLMGLGVLGFVGFGTWSAIWERWAEWSGMSESRRVVAHIGQEEVTSGDLFQFYVRVRGGGHAARAMYLMLGPALAKPEARQAAFALTMGMSAWPLVARDLPDEEPLIAPLAGWLALWREAARRGFEPSDLAIDERLRSLAALGLTPAMLQAVLRETARGEMPVLRDALRTDMALRAYLDWMGSALSAAAGPELREEFVNLDERIQLRMVVLKAEDFLDRVPPPAEDALKLLFEAHKTFPAGGGPDGYGYRIPDRVRLEYLVTDPSAFEAEARAAVTEEAIRRYYDENKDPEFLVKPGPADAPKAPPQEPPKESPQETPAEKPETGAAAPKPHGGAGPEGEPGAAGAAGAASSTAPSAPATEGALAEAPAAAPSAAEPTQAAPSAAEPTPPAEPPKQFLPLDEVRDKIRDELTRQEARRLARAHANSVVGQVRGIRKPEDLRIWADGRKVRYEAVERFLSAAEIGALDGLGRASDGRRAVADVATALPELLGPGKGRIALHEISDVFVDPDGRAYAFRVTAFQPNHVPGSLDLVRDQVAADLKMQEAFALARERAAKLRERASEKGLAAAAKELDLVAPTETDWFARQELSRYYFLFGEERTRTPSLPGVGVSPTLVREVFELHPGGRERTLVTLAARRMVVVAEVAGRRPPREAAYEVFRPMLADEVAGDLGSKALQDVINPTALRVRFGITLVEAEGEGAAARPEVPPDE